MKETIYVVSRRNDDLVVPEAGAYRTLKACQSAIKKAGAELDFVAKQIDLL